MFIAIIGTRCSGKASVENYLTSKGFKPVSLTGQGIDKVWMLPLRTGLPLITAKQWYTGIREQQLPSSDGKLPLASHVSPPQKHSIQAPGMKPLMSFFTSIGDDSDNSEGQLQPFQSPRDLLDYVTEHWEDKFVTTDLKTKELVEYFMKRPFFLLVSVDAPLYQRFRRSTRYDTT